MGTGPRIARLIALIRAALRPPPLVAGGRRRFLDHDRRLRRQLVDPAEGQL
jgi:hypothetical protein